MLAGGPNLWKTLWRADLQLPLVVVVLERADGLTDRDREWIEALRTDVASWAASPATIEEASDGAAATLTYRLDTLGDEDWPDRIDETRVLLEAAPEGLASHVTGGRVAGLVSRAPRRTWAATAGALGVLAITVVGLDLGPDDAGRFRDAPDSVLGQRMLGQHFPAGASTPVEIVADTAGAEEVRSVLADVPGVERVSPGPTSADGARSLLSAALAAPPDSAEARETVREVRRSLDTMPSAAAIVGGWTAQQVDLRVASLRDALVVMPTALVVVGLVLFLLLRAVLGPLVLLATVVLSYVAALGLHSLVMKVMGFEAVELGLPLLAFCFLVPLGVDYTIFLMSRVREEVATHGHRDGVLRGLVATGGVITSARIVLAATFGVLWQMPLTFMVGIGVVVSLGILLDTFVTRSLLVPALCVDLGPRLWWPGAVPSAGVVPEQERLAVLRHPGLDPVHRPAVGVPQQQGEPEVGHR